MRSKCFAGVDVGGTNIKMVLCDASFAMLAQRVIPTNVPAPPAETTGRIGDSIEEMMREAGLGPGELAGICVALPGLVDVRENIPVRMGTLQWRAGAMDVAPMLGERLGVPVTLINDGDAHLTGEHRFGAARGFRNVLLLTLGTGVGGAFMAGGRVVTGERGLSAELGHIVLEVDGEACSCGSRGCMQAYCSARGIQAYARRRMAGCGDTALWKLTSGDPEKLDTAMITAGADAGDALCREIYARTAKYLGAGIATLVSVLNPALILVGGGVAGAHEYLVEPARVFAEERLMHERQHCRIGTVSLGGMAGAWGACAWIAEKSGNTGYGACQSDAAECSAHTNMEGTK